jgi:hypothetical protein
MNLGCQRWICSTDLAGTQAGGDVEVALRLPEFQE